MKFLRHIRSRSRMKHRNDSPEAVIYSPNGSLTAYPADLPPVGLVAAMPTPVLARIFAHVCPHAGDAAYTACEDADLVESECPLCDARDLASCARVCRRWAGPAQSIL